MTVFIDGDGCPVVMLAVRLCQAYHTACVLVSDTAHLSAPEGAVRVIADKGADSVDYLIGNRVQAGDLVITQDYGLASICLAKQARVLHQDGWEYTADNIDALLLARHEARKLRASGRHLKGPRKRTPAQDRAFAACLESLLQTTVQG